MFTQILNDFKKGNIRGSEEIAKWGLRALAAKKEELDNKCSFMSTYLINLKKSRDKIVSYSNTEVALVNVLNAVIDEKLLDKLQTIDEIKRELGKKITKLTKELEMIPHQISVAGSKKIHSCKSIYTHGYSKSVLEIIEKSRKRKLRVSITSCEPFGEGELMSKECSKFIETVLYPDSGIDSAVLSSEAVLLGCHYYNEEEFVCHAGAQAAALVAKFYGIPVYICTDSLRFSNSELLEAKIVGTKDKKVKPIYSKVSSKLITAVICEKGVLNPREFTQDYKYLSI